jgi:hypothetical protein
MNLMYGLIESHIYSFSGNKDSTVSGSGKQACGPEHTLSSRMRWLHAVDFI